MKDASHIIPNPMEIIQMICTFFFRSSGIEKVIQCHGSFASATCMRCKASYTCEDVRADIFAQIVPRCEKCADEVVDVDVQPESQPPQQPNHASDIENSLSSAADTSITEAQITPTTSASFLDKPTASQSRPSETDSEDYPFSDQRLNPTNVIKPDIVFFGESLPELFHQRMAKDKDVCDLLIVIGSSLKVRPVALIPSSISPQIPQVGVY